MSARSKLLGSWECLHFKAINIKDDTDVIHPFTEQIQGSLVYANDGYMATILQNPGNPTGALAGSEGESSKAASMTQGYHGTFSLEEDETTGETKLSHHILIGLLAEWKGTTQVRKCEMWQAEGELYMKLEPELPMKGENGVERRIEVGWRKRKPAHE